MAPAIFWKEAIMLGEVKIGDKKVKMLANAATPFWFNQIFHEDFFTATQDMSQDSTGVTVNVFARMAFVMAKQAGKGDMKKVNEGQFMDWLAEFEAMDLPNAMPEIIELYTAQTKGTATAKK